MCAVSWRDAVCGAVDGRMANSWTTVCCGRFPIRAVLLTTQVGLEFSALYIYVLCSESVLSEVICVTKFLLCTVCPA
jgi:hypothetical protein